jgi:pimeloyl-ACP methyl ester carboxylesterase
LIASQKRLAAGVMERLDDPEALEEFVYQETMVQLLTLPKEQRDQIGDLESYARMATSQAVSQYASASFASFLAYDPAPDWAQTTIPVLAIFGGKDVQVDAGQNAPPVAESLAQAGNRDFAIVVLPEANHLFQAAESGSFSEYGTLPAQFMPDLLPTILDWIELHVVTADEAMATPIAPAGAMPVTTGSATPVAAS